MKWKWYGKSNSLHSERTDEKVTRGDKKRPKTTQKKGLERHIANGSREQPEVSKITRKKRRDKKMFGEEDGSFQTRLSKFRDYTPWKARGKEGGGSFPGGKGTASHPQPRE